MSPLEPGDVFAGEFQVERVLGIGGMGAVYGVVQVSTGKRRALKLMRPELLSDPEQKRRFEQEARVGATIASDHVVEVIAAGVDARTGAPWLAMELLDGEDLGALVARRGPLPHGDVRAIVAQLAHAIGAAHAAGVVHRDLKPENVFVALARREGAPALLVKVLDFGIAKILAGAQAARTSPMGTLAWMAPEQAEDRALIGPAADLWALGLLVFFMLTGRSYWPTDAPISVIVRRLLVDPLESASARGEALGCRALLPAGFDAWFARAVTRDPADRFASAAAARAELDAIFERAGSSSTAALAVTQSASAAAPQRWRIPRDGAPRRGPTDALVTIVEFADFECPFTIGAEDVVREILADHRDDVALVWRDVPYEAHPSAHAAARLARLAGRELGSDGFWSAHDRLLSSPGLRAEDVERVGAELGLDDAAVAAAIAAEDDRDTARDTELALDFRGTLIPHFFVNGRRLVGVRALGGLRALVEEELAAARERVANGAGRADVYDAVTADAAGPPPEEPRRAFRAEQQRTAKRVGARARVDVHQFTDRTSSFAALLERPLGRFLAAHGDDLRFFFHELVDFDDATSVDVGLAARAALDVGGDAGYWRLHAILVANAPQHPPGPVPSRGFSRAALFEYAREAGLHDGYFRVSFENPERRRELERTRDAAAEAGVRAGDFLVLVGGYRGFGMLVAQLERALARAMADVERGI